MVTVESREHIVLAWFAGRTVLRETLRDIQGVWRDAAEAGADSVGRLVQLADAEDASPLECHDLVALAEGSHSPEPCA